MIIVKIQERKKDKIISIPYTMHHLLGEAGYLKCTADEYGIHYAPLEA